MAEFFEVGQKWCQVRGRLLVSGDLSQMLHCRLELQHVRLNLVCALHFFKSQMLQFFCEAQQSVLVELFHLLRLLLEIFTHSPLFIELDLQQVHLRLFFLLAGVFDPDVLLELSDLDGLHVDGVLQLQSLLLQEQVRVPGIIQLATEHHDLLLENGSLSEGQRGSRVLRHVVLESVHLLLVQVSDVRDKDAGRNRCRF